MKVATESQVKDDSRDDDIDDGEVTLNKPLSSQASHVSEERMIENNVAIDSKPSNSSSNSEEETNNQSNELSDSVSVSRSVSMLSLNDTKDLEPDKTFKDLFLADIILPFWTVKKKWDEMLVLLIIYTAIELPLHASFKSVDNIVTEVIAFTILAIFWVDIYFNFKAAYMHKREYVIDRKLIAMNYFAGWFTIDFVSAVPIAEIIQFGLDPSYLKIAHTMQWLHLLRIGRLFRTFSMESLRKMSQAQAFGILTITLLLFSHWLGCVFHELTEFEEHQNWLHEHHIDQKDDFVKYVYSLYYAMTTVTTVGFGDVHGTNALERSYATITTFIGANLYALILALLSLVISQLFAKGETRRQYDTKCTDMSTTLKMGYDFELRLTLHNEAEREVKDQYSVNFLLNLNIANSMKYQIVNKVLKPIIVLERKKSDKTAGSVVKTPFVYCNDSLLLFIARHLEVHFCGADEVLYNHNEIDTKYIYIIISGTVRIYNQSDSEISRLKKGTYFGDVKYFYPTEKYAAVTVDADSEIFDSCAVHHKTIKPFTDVAMYALPFEKFAMIEKYDKSVYKLFARVAQKRAEQYESYSDRKIVHSVCSKMERKNQNIIQHQQLYQEVTNDENKQTQASRYVEF